MFEDVPSGTDLVPHRLHADEQTDPPFHIPHHAPREPTARPDQRVGVSPTALPLVHHQIFERGRALAEQCEESRDGSGESRVADQCETDPERQAISAGLRSREAFTLRRAQILLASAEGHRPARIAAHVGCAIGTVHNTLHAFEKEGAGCLKEKKRGPKDAQPVLDEAKADPLKGILHQSPRRFGKAQSTWTLDLLADVAFEQELTPRRLSHEAVRQAVKRLGSGWKRAKKWITSPDPAHARKKKRGTA
ncbi:helix-turn-helix domain-containing protein [Gemmata sp. SH-PL17]|uniref:helix-turn-helix domain-containing protein n=1 Tax=Gemmata sp. SH-PL17 TaxID=1630693 RepID=UPI001952216D|nr:helix-turn-helix domain-containing protein [Gemmata sp. SH-PL17]